jgi:hypothetical protein
LREARLPSPGVHRRYGDWLRSGWRNVLDAVLRLHRLDLLPAAVIAGARRSCNAKTELKCITQTIPVNGLGAVKPSPTGCVLYRSNVPTCMQLHCHNRPLLRAPS